MTESSNGNSREARIAGIGRRANALMRAGYYTRADLDWLRDYVRSEDCDFLVDVEVTLAQSERNARSMARQGGAER